MAASTRIEPHRVAASAAALLLVLAALAGVVQLAGGSGYFRTRDWQVGVSTLVVFLCGLCTTLGGRLLVHSRRDVVGWLAVIVGLASAVPLAVGTWWLSGWREHAELLGKVVATTIVVLLAVLVVAGARSLQNRTSLAAAASFGVVVLSAIVVVTLALADVWSVDPTGGDTGTATGDVGGRITAGVSVIGVAAFLLTALVDHVPLPRLRPSDRDADV